ncbi:MAG: DUF1015 domain-containing protein [Fimbriimonadaceae bacterium]|nr:DUF1015 domain-containing protein [Fimbriimonadaceae bacterium]
MADMRAFRGLRYTARAGDLANLVAPPYDVVSPEMRERLAAEDLHNYVLLTLPEAQPDDRSRMIKYARSAARLEEWVREGVLAPDAKPSLYRLTQTFTVPNSTAQAVRTAVIALIKVEPYSQGSVLPHEQTFPKHKEDRLRLLEATRSHLESILGLYEDEGAQVHQMVRSAPATRIGEVRTEFDGTMNVLDAIEDEASVQALLAAMSARRVWIADGHHRYETALNFRGMFPASAAPVAEDFMMMAMTSMDDPGLVLLPTHRILKQLGMSADAMRSALADAFAIEDVPNAEIPARLTGPGVFGVALPGGNGFLATVCDIGGLAQGMEGSDRLRRLDVSILHGPIFADRLGLTGHDFFGYTRVDQEALDAVESGAPAAFLMAPPSVEDMKVVALNGEVMPQKSTYYHPKLPSGVVAWRLKEF